MLHQRTKLLQLNVMIGISWISPYHSVGNPALLRCSQKLMQLFRNAELLHTMGLFSVCQPATEVGDTLAASPAGVFLSILSFTALHKNLNLLKNIRGRACEQ